MMSLILLIQIQTLKSFFLDFSQFKLIKILQITSSHLAFLARVKQDSVILDIYSPNHEFEFFTIVNQLKKIDHISLIHLHSLSRRFILAYAYGPYFEHPPKSRLSSLSPTEQSICALEISRAVEYLHARRITHGNISLKNIFIENDNLPVLSGFLDQPSKTVYTAHELFLFQRDYTDKLIHIHLEFFFRQFFIKLDLPITASMFSMMAGDLPFLLNLKINWNLLFSFGPETQI
jgi:serine/threonine protein kinase